MSFQPFARVVVCAFSLAGMAGCAYEVGFQPAYVPDETPRFVADGKILIVMPDEQQQFVYTSPPSSVTGDYTTLTVPMGEIARDIADRVFSSCFGRGVEFADERVPNGDYVVALEGNMQEFIYNYTKVIEQGFDGQPVDSWIIPEVDIAFDVLAFDRRGAQILGKTYDSGVMAGPSYRVTSRPAERINETLHTTLHALMLQIADDLKPLLIGECTVIDID